MRRTRVWLALLACFVLLGVVGVTDATSDLDEGTPVAGGDDDGGDGEEDGATLWPRILWAQRRHVLYVRMVTRELRPDTVDVAANDTHLVFEAQGRGGECASFPLQQPITNRHAM